MTERFRVAAVQMVSSHQLQENLDSAAAGIAQAAARGAKLVVLPEYFCLMGLRDTDKLAIREPFGDGPIQRFLSSQAAGHGIWLVGGTLPLDTGGTDKVTNTSLAFDPQGKLAARYDKIHLFSFARGEESYNEGRTLIAGREPVAFDTPFGRVGMSICYDLRFPELYRALGDCVLMLAPSAFTATTGKAHWDLLVRARAVENQCYLLAAAQGGVHSNRRATHGHSMLVDPWGEIVAQADAGFGVVVGDIDSDRIREVRKNLPALSHRTL
jgi:predicted amidohydrolase